MNRSVITILLSIILCVVHVRGMAQDTKSNQNITYKKADKGQYTEALDAVIAAPDNHKILLENDKVRVLEVTVKPGEVEPLHHHRWSSVLYVQQAGEFLDYDSDGNLIFDSRNLKEPMQTPYTMFKESEAPHTVTNLNKTEPMRLLRVELKDNSNTNLAIIDGLYQAFRQGDIPAVLGAMDSKVIWNEAESNALAVGNPYIGPEAVLNGVFAKIGELYKSFALKDIKLHNMSNNQVLATLSYVIISKSGKNYTVQAAHHYTLKEGKIIQFQQYVDTKKLSDAEKH